MNDLKMLVEQELGRKIEEEEFAKAHQWAQRKLFITGERVSDQHLAWIIADSFIESAYARFTWALANEWMGKAEVITSEREHRAKGVV